MTPRSGSDPSIDFSKGVFNFGNPRILSTWFLHHLDSATPPFGSAQNESILRGFLNPGFDVRKPTLKCILLVILHEGYSCLKLQNPL